MKEKILSEEILRNKELMGIKGYPTLIEKIGEAPPTVDAEAGTEDALTLDGRLPSDTTITNNDQTWMYIQGGNSGTYGYKAVLRMPSINFSDTLTLLDSSYNSSYNRLYFKVGVPCGLGGGVNKLLNMSAEDMAKGGIYKSADSTGYDCGWCGLGSGCYSILFTIDLDENTAHGGKVEQQLVDALWDNTGEDILLKDSDGIKLVLEY